MNGKKVSRYYCLLEEDWYEVKVNGEVLDEVEIEMPKGAKILSAWEDFNKVYITALVTPTRKNEKHIFHVFYQEYPIKGNWKFLETIAFHGKYDHPITVMNIFHRKESPLERWTRKCKKSGGD